MVQTIKIVPSARAMRAPTKPRAAPASNTTGNANSFIVESISKNSIANEESIHPVRYFQSRTFDGIDSSPLVICVSRLLVSLLAEEIYLSGNPSVLYKNDSCVSAQVIFVGVMPIHCRSERVRCAWSKNPHCQTTSAIGTPSRSKLTAKRA